MAWETIEVVKPKVPGSGACPGDGVKICARSLGTRGGGRVRYIHVTIGAELARSIALNQPEHRLLVLFGTGDDAGKIAVAVDGQIGRFLAKRNKSGAYAFAINAATADGLFALDFSAFTVARCEAIRPVNGQPPKFIFKASAEMLKVED